MRKDDLTRMRHMLDAARDAIVFSRNKNRQALTDDRMLVLSLVKSIEIPPLIHSLENLVKKEDSSV